MNKYAFRLAEEWKQHGKIIIAVDWDDTLSPWKLHKEHELHPVWSLLKTCKYTGAYITIFTACNEDRYPEIMKYCEKKGLIPDSINQNPINLPYGNQNKVYANIFLDDRAGLDEAMRILEQALYIHNGYLQSIKDLDEIG